MNEIIKEIDKKLSQLFPINRSITGPGLRESLGILKISTLPNSEMRSVASGSKVFDWTVPSEWSVETGYIENKNGKRIVDLSANNLHVVSYSAPIDKIVEKKELLEHIHTIPEFPDRIPYRTSYYTRNWGFCCKHELLQHPDFCGPFKVHISSTFKNNGELNWLEDYHEGEKKDEILISSYCCHPNLANDNLSGMVLAAELFKHIKKQKTKFSYRLVILPETIGAISFLHQADLQNIIAGCVVTCVAGPGKFSIKQGFDTNHWINKSAHLALQSIVDADYITYPFIPDGSDERQYSSPGVRIVTPSIHKSKYYEYDEYHTCADDLSFISASNLNETLIVYKKWFSLIESLCYPKRTNLFCEYELGRRNLYPGLGGSIKQPANFSQKKLISDENLDAFHWLMHLADGKKSNFDIAEASGLDIEMINDSINLFREASLLEA